MNIKFKDVAAGEDGCIWYDLYVKTDDKDWHNAEETYYTSDENEVRNIIIQSRQCDKVVESFNKYLKTMFSQDLAFDPMEDLCDYDSPWGVSLCEGSVTVIANSDLSAFEVGYITYDGGSRWEPPSSDYVEHSKEQSLRKALMAALLLYVEDDYNTWCINEWENHEPVIEEEAYDNLNGTPYEQ